MDERKVIVVVDVIVESWIRHKMKNGKWSKVYESYKCSNKMHHYQENPVLMAVVPFFSSFPLLESDVLHTITILENKL